MAILGDKAVGSIVKIKENGVAQNYIIVHKGRPSSMYDSSCIGVWVLRQKAHSTMAWGIETGWNCKNDYENSAVHPWLNGEFYYTINSEIRSKIKGVKIPYRKGSGTSTTVQSGSNGLYCKIFLLSGYEVGFINDSSQKGLPIDGEKLSYFSDNASRMVDDFWWLRSPSLSNSSWAWTVASSGEYYQLATDETFGAVRPAFILPTDIVVGSDGTLGNTSPIISGSRSSGSNMGEISAPFDFTYTVNDADNDTVTVKEYLDNVLQRSSTASLGATNTFQATSDPVQFQKILNGSHTIQVIATDTVGNSSSSYTVYFNKQLKTATITLTTPLPADDVIKAAVLTVTGNIPQDATLKVLVTNNAKDSSPVWEDMTQDYLKKINHLFSNKAAANGFAFNFKVTVTRGASGTQGYISSIGGAFE